MYSYKTDPYDHQRAEFEASRATEGRALWWEMGCGKTKPTIDTASWLFMQGEITGLLVLAPNSVHVNWSADEIPIHMPDEVRERSRILTWYTAKSRNKGTAREMSALLAHDGLAVLVMSYNAFCTDLGAKAAKKLLQDRRCMYVIDESTRIKSPGTKVGRRVIASSSYAAYRRALTGTPVDNSPFDVYAQCKFVRPDLWASLGLRTFDLFKKRFGLFERRTNFAQGRQYDALVRYLDLDDLHTIVDSVGSRLLKADVLDLPPKTYEKRWFDLDAAQCKAYKDLDKEMRTWLESGEEVTADLAIVRMTRMQQIACGYVGTDEEGLVDFGRNGRLATLLEIVEDISGSAIIWAKYDRDIDLIMSALGTERAVSFDGRTDDEGRALAKRRFQAEGSAQFFVAKASAAGEGLTLHRAKTVVYYNNTFKLRERLQSEDRAHRAGMSPEPVHYIDILARDTVDEQILDALRQKRSVASVVTGDQLADWA